MPYATLDQLTDRYGERLLVALTDRGEVATGVIDADVTDRALSDADAVIDGYLKARYALPLSATPPLIVVVAQAIAIWHLHVSAPDPKVEADYKEALRTLRDIASGIVQLDVAGAAPASSGGGQARVTDRERPFTADKLKGFI